MFLGNKREGDLRTLVLGLVALITINATALTKHSKHIAQLQKTFGKINKDKPIVYLDRDTLGALFAQSVDETHHVSAIQNFVMEKSGVYIDAPDADTLMKLFKFNYISASLVKNKNNEKVCVIIPSNPNFNQEQSNIRLLGWYTDVEIEGMTKEPLYNAPEFINKKIVDPLSREVMELMSDLHETFHCLDNNYLPKAMKHEVDFHMIHKSETFAEVGALLYLSKMGYKDIMEKRAQLREVGSTFSNKYISINPLNPGPWGAIYSLQRPIRSIASHLENEFIVSWDLSKIIEFANAITEIESLNTHEFYAMESYFSDPELLSNYIEEYTHPNYDFEYLKNRFLIVKQTVESYNESLANSYDLLLEDILPSDAPTIQNEMTFDVNSDCPDLNYNVDLDNFDQTVDELRNIHYLKNSSDKGFDDLLLKNLYRCYVLNTTSSNLD